MHVKALTSAATSAPEPSGTAAPATSTAGEDNPHFAQLKALLLHGLFEKPDVATHNSFDAIASEDLEDTLQRIQGRMLGASSEKVLALACPAASSGEPLQHGPGRARPSSGFLAWPQSPSLIRRNQAALALSETTEPTR